MKKLLLLCLVLTLSAAVYAQKYKPVIKNNSTLNYKAVSRATGQPAVITLTLVNIAAPVKIKWAIPYVGTGFFEMSAASMQSAVKTIAKEPDPDEVTKIDDDKTLIVISKDSFNSLVNTKTFKLNNYTFNVQPDTSNYKINDKPADVFYAVSTRGSREIWILNNPDFPLICCAKRVTPYIDFSLVTLTE